MKLEFKPPSCFGWIHPYNDELMEICQSCRFIKECQAKYEEDEEEYRYWHHIP